MLTKLLRIPGLVIPLVDVVATESTLRRVALSESLCGKGAKQARTLASASRYGEVTKLPKPCSIVRNGAFIFRRLYAKVGI